MEYAKYDMLCGIFNNNLRFDSVKKVGLIKNVMEFSEFRHVLLIVLFFIIKTKKKNEKLIWEKETTVLIMKEK